MPHTYTHVDIVLNIKINYHILTAMGFVSTSFIYSATVIGPVSLILAFNCLQRSVSADFGWSDEVWNVHLDPEILINEKGYWPIRLTALI